MFAWCGWMLIGLPFAYFIQKKYNRGWMVSILAGMGIAIVGAIVIGFIVTVMQSLQ